MAGFRFSLEVVRRLRKQAQDAQRRAVADAIRSVVEVQARIDRLGEQLRETVNQTRHAQEAAYPSISRLRGNQVHLGWLRKRIAEANIELTRRRELLAERREELARATKELDVIEKLRERQKMRYEMRIRRLEQAAADEAALQTYRRGRGNPNIMVAIT